MAWFGTRSARARHRAAAAAAGVTAIAIALTGAAAPAPAGGWSGDPADDVVDWASAVPGFVLSEGRFAAFQAPDADVALHPRGINDRGEVTGEYVGPDGESAFVRTPGGRITVFDVPGAQATEAFKINDGGQVVGRYSDDTPLVDDSSRVRGYVRHRGKVTRLDFPRARHTLPTGINDRGDVVGYYVDAGGTTHGFLWRNRRFTTLDLVGAQSPTPVDINDHGVVVGLYLDDAGAAHGFLLSEGRYTTISAPGATVTVPAGINDRGEVVGYRAGDVELAAATGFRRVPRGAAPAETPGPADYTPIGVPGAPRTLALGINDRGDVVGLNESPDDTARMPDAAEQVPGMSSGLDLVTVRGITVNATIGDRVDTLLAAAEADGLSFSGGGYRDNARQVELRRQNCGTSYYAVYEMPASTCSPPTARPGTSMHERGLAIDFSCDGELIRSRSNPCFQWLDEHAATYGLYNLPSEPWHWSVDGS